MQRASAIDTRLSGQMADRIVPLGVLHTPSEANLPDLIPPSPTRDFRFWVSTSLADSRRRGCGPNAVRLLP